MTKLTLKCICCEFEETIEMNHTMLGLKAVGGKGALLRDVIEDKGWSVIKTIGSEGYCCEECRTNSI